MKFWTLMFLCCSAVLCADSSTSWKFEQLAKTARQELKNPQIGKELLELDALLKTDELTAQELQNMIESVQASLMTEEAQTPFLNRIKAELLKATFELKLLRAKEAKKVRDCPSSVCNGVTPAPTVITVPGHYCLTADNTSGIVIASSNVELSLDTHSITINSGPGIVVTSASNVKISGCGRISGGTLGILVLDSDNVVIEDLILVNSRFGIGPFRVNDFTVKNCYIEASLQGIGIEGVPNVTATSNVQILSSIITGSNTRSDAAGIALNAGIRDITIEDCFFDNNTYAITTLFINNDIIGPQNGPIERLTCRRCFMDNSQVNAINIQQTTDFAIFDSTIDTTQTVVDAIRSGSGIYLSQVDNFQMQNTQIRNTVAQGIQFAQDVNNVEVESCQILNTGTSPVDAIGLYNGSFTNSTFSTVTNQPCAAMNFVGSEALLVKDCTLSAIVQDPVNTAANGLAIQDCTGCIVEGLIVETNARGEDTSGNGILITGNSSNVALRGCIVPSIQPNIANIGIFVTGPNSGVSIEDCTVDGAFKTGIRLEQLQYGTVKNTLVKSVQTGSGIVLKEANGVALFGNMVTNNATHGIHLEKGTVNCCLRDNSVAKNKKIGINNHSEQSSNTIYHNFAQANEKQNYKHVDLVSGPHKKVGVLENISE